MPKINTVLACCDGLHAPKTHAATAWRPNLRSSITALVTYFLEIQAINKMQLKKTVENNGNVGRAWSTTMVLNT